MGNLSASRLCIDTNELIALPYMQRQLVVVADDKAIRAELKAREAALRAAEAKQEAEQLEAMRKEAERQQAAGKTGWRGVVGNIRMPDVDIDVASFPVIEGVLDALSNEEEHIDALTIGYRAASHLTFPAGHPRYDVLYVGHPTLPSTYYTAANFHRLTFEHKFYEALKLLMSLGATCVTVERESGWSHEVAAEAEATLGAVQGQGGRKQTANSRILFEAELPGAKQPTLPLGLVWYPYEPTWQAIAEGRLNYGITSFKLVIEYTDDLNINAQLGARAGKAGLDLGGTFTNFEATIWNMSGEFAA